MTRRVVTTQVEATGSKSLDTYFDRVVKYIPSDIVAAWVAVGSIIKSSNEAQSATVWWICFGIGAVLTALWTRKQTMTPGQRCATKQVVVSTMAFGVWVFALGAPFTTLSWYQPLYASLGLVGFTLVCGLLE